MKKILHLFTSPPIPLAEEIIADQKADSANEVNVTDLTSSPPDYARVVQLIFESDAIHTW